MADFQTHSDAFAKLGVSLVAASVDSREDARKVVAELGLTYPVAWGIDARAIARTYGAFIDETDPYVHATGFVVAPDGTIAVASYSNGAIGRLGAEDVLALVTHMRDSAPQKA